MINFIYLCIISHFSQLNHTAVYSKNITYKIRYCKYSMHFQKTPFFILKMMGYVIFTFSQFKQSVIYYFQFRPEIFCIFGGSLIFSLPLFSSSRDSVLCAERDKFCILIYKPRFFCRSLNTFF